MLECVICVCYGFLQTDGKKTVGKAKLFLWKNDRLFSLCNVLNFVDMRSDLAYVFF